MKDKYIYGVWTKIKNFKKRKFWVGKLDDVNHAIILKEVIAFKDGNFSDEAKQLLKKYNINYNPSDVQTHESLEELIEDLIITKRLKNFDNTMPDSMFKL